MPDWETYYKELLARGHGHAVWDADPGSDPAVDIADVGYMEEGSFVRLFNASKDIGDVSNKFGTPDGYKPLRIGAVKEGTLSASLPITSETVLQRKIGISLSGGPIVQSGGSFVFECTKEQGAVLILAEDADRRNALQKQLFIRYVLENHSTWLKFANEVHERGVSLDQLLLVTGCDRTSAWACAAFSASSNKLGLEFHVGSVGVGQGAISVWGSWNNCHSVHAHSGPRLCRTLPSDLLPRASEPKAADFLSRENSENGLSSSVDGVSQVISSGHVARLVDGIKVEQGTTSLVQDKDACTASSDALHSILLSRIILYSWVLGRLLFCMCRYTFFVACGSPPSDPIQSLRFFLSEAVGLTHVTSKSPTNTDVVQPSRDKASEEHSTPSKTPSRNQCVFVRGFKICDRSTMKKRLRLLGRKKPPPEDGFTHLIGRKKDDKDDPGRPRGSSGNNSCYSFGERESASGHSRGTGEDTSSGTSSQSQYGSQYSLGPSITASETDTMSLFDTQSDHEFALYQQCHELTQPTHLDILMEYILEKSSAELALVHHDDLATMLEHVTSMSVFESVLYQLSPTIFMDNGIGMLESTFRASQDANSKNDVPLVLTSNAKKQALLSGGNRILGTELGLTNSKLLEDTLSFVRTEVTSARVERMLMPWDLQTTEAHCVNICSAALRPSYSMPRIVSDVLLENRRSVSVDGMDGLDVMEIPISRFSRISREMQQPEARLAIVDIPAANPSYFDLSKRYVTEWVDAQWNNAPAVPDPPNTDVETISCHFVSSCFNSVKGFTSLSFVLSDRIPRVGLSKPGVSSNISSVKSVSFFSSSVWSSSHGTGNALKHLREKVTSAMGYPSIMTRSRHHISLLRKWERGRGKGQLVGFEQRIMVLGMLQDALEISRDCYATRYHRVAYKIGRQVQRWLQSFIPQSSETTQWLIQVHVGLMSLLLSRISRLDPIMSDLAQDILLNLTRIPISLQEHSTTAAVICLVVNELSYSQHRFQHSWLGVWLARIVDLTLKVRYLTEQEVKAFRTLAMRRKEDQSIVRSVKCCRPWEVALFAQMAVQETWFKPIVLDIHGFPSLVDALERMLADTIDRHAVHWNRVALTLRAMSFSLEQKWIASIVKPRIISSLLRVFRRSIPEKWFCIRFWATDAIRNLVAHQPSLVQTLREENAIAAIETLANPKLDLTASHFANRRVNEIKTSVQKRLIEDYQREGLKRAAELVVYVEQWTPESLPTLKLGAVASGWGGYLGGIEEDTD